MLDYHLNTNIGNRKINEDYAIAARRKDGVHLFIVCDGLGGHGKGDAAAKFVAENLKDTFLKAEKINEKFFYNGFNKVQDELLKEKSHLDVNGSMLTTVVALLIDKDYFQFAHAGDSRFYAFKDGKAVMRSKDHSLPQLLLDEGKITEDELRTHPDRNKIVRAFGVPMANFDFSVSKIFKYDNTFKFLLCTDGFWECMYEDDMEKFISKYKDIKKCQDKCMQFIQKCKTTKNKDNFTSIFIDVK